MLRNYPVKTSIGFLIWFIGTTIACIIINYPVARILAYTSLIFYGVLQGWSIRETYKQELERAERKNPALNPSADEDLAVNLSPEKAKVLKIVIYGLLSVATVFTLWGSFIQHGFVQIIIAAACIAATFAAFRFDRVHELQTAREITMGTSILILFFVFLLPLSFKANLIAAAALSAGMYISAFGMTRSPQRIVLFNKKDFQVMEAMEKEFYGSEYITPAEKVQEWYEVYPYTTCACRKGNEIAGFINMFPVKQEVSEALRAGTFNDACLELKDIASMAVMNPEKRADMFFSCIVVKPQYRGGEVSKELIYDAVTQYEAVYHCIDNIYIDAVTEEGRKMAEKYGFTKLCESDHGTMVYECDFNTFKDRVLEG